mgnify:CR=1 FL=1
MIRILLTASFILAFLPLPAGAQGHAHNSGEEHTSGGHDNNPVEGQPSASNDEVTNPLCPVTVDEPSDPAIFLEHEGKRVYFGCIRCRKQFLEDPEAYVANLPQFDSEPEAHSHEEDHAPNSISTNDRLIRFAGKFHPVVVHFPIGLLIAALFSEILGAVYPILRFREAARVLVNLGAPMAALAAALGWATGQFANYPGELEQVLSTHGLFGISAAVLALTTLALLELYWRKQGTGLRVAYLSALVLTALIVGVTGHLGGTLIHGTEHFTW